MAAVTIRAARASDAGEIAQLTTQLGYDLTQADAADRLTRVVLLRDDQQLFVADVDGRAVGWVHVVFAEYVDAEAFVVIGGLVVDRNQRRLGIGRALMDRAEVWARERGCSMVRLTSSATRNTAHWFYENLGYTNIKTQYSYQTAGPGRPLHACGRSFRAWTPPVEDCHSRWIGERGLVQRTAQPKPTKFVRRDRRGALRMIIDFRGLTPLIQVFDMPASIRFYCDALGFAVVTASGPVPDCGWALLRRKADEIMFPASREQRYR
jgi:GNAT superfamily N-acetyltransferase